ncbi:hypothetical protein ACJX0J_024440, partial [Zea mays]
RYSNNMKVQKVRMKILENINSHRKLQLLNNKGKPSIYSETIFISVQSEESKDDPKKEEKTLANDEYNYINLVNQNGVNHWFGSLTIWMDLLRNNIRFCKENNILIDEYNYINLHNILIDEYNYINLHYIQGMLGKQFH